MLTTLPSGPGPSLPPDMLVALTTLAGAIEALVEAHAHHVLGITLETPDVDKRQRDDDAARTNCESAFLLVQQLIVNAAPA